MKWASVGTFFYYFYKNKLKYKMKGNTIDYVISKVACQFILLNSHLAVWNLTDMMPMQNVACVILLYSGNYPQRYDICGKISLKWNDNEILMTLIMKYLKRMIQIVDIFLIKFVTLFLSILEIKML